MNFATTNRRALLRLNALRIGAIGVMAATLVFPLAAWVAASSFPSRIGKNDELTEALIHASIVHVYAGVLVTSILINIAITVVRFPSRPRTQTTFRSQPLCVLVLFLCAGLWFDVIATSSWAINFLEPVTAVATSAASTVVCVFATRRDSLAAERARAVRAVRRDKRRALPMASRRRRRLRIIVPAAGLLVCGALALAVYSTITVSYEHCLVTFTGTTGGFYSEMDTANCGTFDIPAGAAGYRKIENSAVVNVTSRGWSFSLPPRQLLVSIKETH